MNSSEQSQTRRFKLPRLYKNLLLLAVVIGPLWWLLLTEDGRRRTDLVMLELFGEPALFLNLQVLDPQFSESQFMTLYPDLNWQCQTRSSEFGNRICHSRISIFNDVPARYVTLFFQGPNINALKLVYRPRYHTYLRGELTRQLGVGRNRNNDSILSWQTEHGYILIPTAAEREAESALLWISPAQMAVNDSASENP